MKSGYARLALSAALNLASGSVWAETPAVEFAGSGFLSLGLGKMLSGTRANVGDFECPCFAADYAQAGVYDGRSGLQWKPDSKLGVQGVASFENKRFSLTAQAVARGARDGRINLEWFYGSYRLDETIALQVGRKRLPMFYYSDTQDIGVALPWTHLPPQLYGWEAVNYNGANLTIQNQFGGWSSTLNLLMGAENIKDAGYDRIYYGRRSRTDVKWNNILGGDLTLQKEGFETRLVYIESDTSLRKVTGPWDATINDYDSSLADPDYVPAKQRIMGVSFNVDYDDWLARTEFIHINRPGLNFKDYAYIIAGGKRFGKWQTMLTQSRYRGTTLVDRLGDPDALEGHVNDSITVRYDLTASSAIKAQLDMQRDRSGPRWSIGGGPAYGNAKLLSITYDLVF
ncbi:MAG TPA: hypothetical protein VJ001_09360 [Rhodocyclaceae bacterium]|nr:hypothetical protein [Rhodocyclaceae bacterium]